MVIYLKKKTGNQFLQCYQTIIVKLLIKFSFRCSIECGLIFEKFNGMECQKKLLNDKEKIKIIDSACEKLLNKTNNE